MTITVKRDTSAPMRHLVQVRSHELAVDVAPGSGGEDSGPDPHDLYDAALGACKALTVLWYAKRKGMPVETIDVGVTRDASGEREGIYRLATTLEIGGELSPAQRAELLSVAAKCPVHKLMTTADTQITTDLK